MNGHEFSKSKWCRDAQSPNFKKDLKKNYNKYLSRINNTGLCNRFKDLYDFFVSGDISATAKIITGGALLYIITPLDLVPDLIPVIGWLDDLGIAGFALSYIFSQMDELRAKNLKIATKDVEKSKSTESLIESEIDGTDGNIATINLDIPTNTSSESLKKNLEDLKNIANALDFNSFNTFASKAENILSGTSITKLAFVGRYSTGKSTLINSLLDCEFLPTSPIPTTKSVTYILKGEKDSLYSEDENGVITSYDSISTIRDRNNKEILNAKRIVLTCAEFPFNNLTIVDTPGLEESNREITRLTYDIIPDVDAFVVLLDAGYIESKAEFRFIESLLKMDSQRKLFIVINKTDSKTADEISEIKKKCAENLVKYGISSERLFAFSAKNGNRDPIFTKFKKTISDFLKKGIKEESFRHIQSELNSYTKDMLNLCENSLRCLNATEQQRIENEHKADIKIQEIRENFEKQKFIFKKRFESYRSRFFLDFSNFIGELKSVLSSEILKADLDTLRNTNEIANKANLKIKEFIENKILEIGEYLENDFTDGISEISNYLSESKLDLKITIKDYSEYSSIVVPTAIAFVFLTSSIFTTISFIVLAMVGRSYFEKAIDDFLKKFGANKIRQQLIKNVSSSLDSEKSNIVLELNKVFDYMENEYMDQFDTKCSNCISQISVTKIQSKHSKDEILCYKEKLLSIAK